MRKFAALITVLVIAFLLSSCSVVKEEDDLSTPLTEAFVTEQSMPEGSADIGAAPMEEETVGDIIILYTNDVHCGINNGLGYSGVAAIKKEMMKKTPYVTLVDVGDHLQGDTIGAFSKGSYIVQIMNKVGYDIAVLGNHEFDYGLRSINSCMMAAQYQYVDCNVEYTGSGNNPFFGMKPYEIVEYGSRKVAFIGIGTPETMTTTNPVNLQENDEIVVDFSSNTPIEFYDRIQQSIDDCRAAGADYVVLLAHIGVEPVKEEFGSDALIANIEGADVILDAHSHSFLCEEYLTDKNGNEVIRSSTGTKLQSVGQLLISADGNISTSLITAFPEKDDEVQAFIDKIMVEYQAETEIPVGTSEFDLRISDDADVRMVRTRETNLGDLCADAYRTILGAQIGWTNGGGVRDNIDAGEITYGDILRVSPFGTELSLINAKGQHILDALEMASMKTEKEYKTTDGKAIGETGSFAQVSGLKYTINTKIESTVVLNNDGSFSEVAGERRVKDVYIENPDGSFEEIDPDKYYTMAISQFISKYGGDGMNMFQDDDIILDACDQDYNVVMKYITENLGGNIPEQYEMPAGRITIE